MPNSNIIYLPMGTGNTKGADKKVAMRTQSPKGEIKKPSKSRTYLNSDLYSPWQRKGKKYA